MMRQNSIKIVLATILMHFLGSAVAEPSSKSEGSAWFHAENLVDRLKEENWKFQMVLDELNRLEFVLQDLRDLQLYPRELTRLTPDQEVILDRRLEKIEKKSRVLRESLNTLKKPMDEAILISQEMLKEEPNVDMISNLSDDNIRRIQKFIKIKREAAGLWDEITEVLMDLRLKIGIKEPVESKSAFEEGFFKALLQNIGKSSDAFYQKFNEYKDSLTISSPKTSWDLMARIDLNRIKSRSSKQNSQFVQKGLSRLSHRFSGKIPIGIINYYLALSYLADEKEDLAIQAFQQVGTDSRKYSESRMGILQALFTAGRDSSVVKQYQALSQKNILNDSLLTHARYLVIQSYYILGNDTALEKEVMVTGKRNTEHNKSLIVFAKSLIRRNRLPEASEALRSLLRQTQLPEKLRNDAQILLAHLHYEQALFPKALSEYKELIDKRGFQAEALYGMVWCQIQLQDFDAAEFILKKLINQYPDNPWAVDGFLVLSRRLALKAQEAWEFSNQVSLEKEKLDGFEKALKEKLAKGLFTREYSEKLESKLLSARKKLEKESQESPDAIAHMYTQALALCEFVRIRYRTGEYSELDYSGERQRVMQKFRQLDPGSQGASGNIVNEKFHDKREEVKSKLVEVRELELDLNIRHKEWLLVFLKKSQQDISSQIASLPQDSNGNLLAQKLRTQRFMLSDEISEKVLEKTETSLKLIEVLKNSDEFENLKDWLLFQEGLLRYELAECELSKRWDLFQWTDNNHNMIAQAEPTIEHVAYEEPWKLLLDVTPNSPYVPATLYYLGFSNTARMASEKGIQYFEKLSSKYPNSQYTSQANVFIGDYYFNHNDLIKAAAAFDKVLSDPDSKNFDQALYKLAWTFYRDSHYKKAISSFTVILDEALKNQNKKKESVLKDEALQFAALSIAESDTSDDGGIGQTKRFASKLGDQRLGATLMHRMAVIYTQQGRLERAKRALESLLKEFPKYEKNPQVMMDLARAYDKEQDFESSAEIREKIFSLYNRQSEWYASQSLNRNRETADSVCEEALKMVAKHYFFEAKQSEIKKTDGPELSQNYYQKAVGAYEKFLSVYQSSPNYGKFSYQLAEAYFAMKDYGSAAKRYMLASRSEDKEIKMQAAYNAIVAAQELLKKSANEK